MAKRKKFDTIPLEKIQSMSPHEIGKQDPKLLYHTYQRMRKIANQRLQNLKRLGHSTRDIYKTYKEEFLPKPSFMSETEIKESILKARVFLGIKESTARGQKAADKRRRKQIDMFTGEWIKTLNDQELELYGDFMDKLRATSTFYLIYDTASLQELWNIYQQNPDIEDFSTDPLMKEAWEKFISEETTIPARRTKYKTKVKKDKNTVNSEAKRLAKIRERNKKKK